MEVVIDGKKVEVKYDETILEVARRNGIEIPTLCHFEGLSGITSCRICMVEILENGVKKSVVACSYRIHNQIEIITDSPKIQKIRNVLLNLYSTRVPNNKEIKQLKEKYNVPEFKRLCENNPETYLEENCILCGLCVKACEALGTNAISTVFRGAEKRVGTAFDEPSDCCIGCATCSSVCPTGAIKLTERNDERYIWGKTFKMVKCKDCGEYFATEEEIQYLTTRLGEETDITSCERCRKKSTATKFKDALKSEYEVI